MLCNRVNMVVWLILCALLMTACSGGGGSGSNTAKRLSTWVQVNPGTCSNPEISLDVTVTDPEGVLDLKTLTLADFTLSENGIPIDPLAITFTNLQPTPVSVVLALDWSTSVTNIVPDISAAAKSFVDQLNDSDQAAIAKFNDVLEFFPISSSDFVLGNALGKTELKAYIDGSFQNILGTRFYDAVFQSIDRAALGTNGKRAVIVLSDGVEESGATPSTVKTLDQVIANAKQKGIVVFTIFNVDPNYLGGKYGNTQVMQRLAQETGGQYYNSNTADLTAIFNQISSVLSNTYTLKYKTSSSCTGTISLDLSVKYNELYGQDSINTSLQ